MKKKCELPTARQVQGWGRQARGSESADLAPGHRHEEREREREGGVVGIEAETMRASRARGIAAAAVVVLVLALVRPSLGQVARGRVTSWEIREASGLAASRRHKGVLYTHNDSGDRPRVFAINEWGSYLGTYEIGGAAARDWEDIAVGPGPVQGQDYLYVGDIGDNRAYFPTKVVYRVMEPNASTDPAAQRSEVLTGVEKFEFRFPGHAGNANAETLLVDPHTGDLFIVRKTAQHPLQVFWARAPLVQGEVIDLEEYHVTCVDYNQECRNRHHTSPSKGELVGGDISPSGLGLLIKSYSSVYYWRRSSTEESFFDSDPRVLPYTSERQGEAICWDAKERGYFTLSEGRNQMLYYYPYQQHNRWVDTVNRWKTGFRWSDAMEDSASTSSAPEAVTMGEKEGEEEEQNQVTAAQFSWDERLAPKPNSASSSRVSGVLVNGSIVASGEECLDLPAPTGKDCEEEAAAGRCELSWMVSNGFCSKSCGRCGEGGGGASQLASGRHHAKGIVFTESVPVDTWWTHWMNSFGWPVASSGSRGADPGTPTCGVEADRGITYMGPITAAKFARDAGECCQLCDAAGGSGGKRCDTWSFCGEPGGCGRFQTGICLLKRSFAYERRVAEAWVSGYAQRGGSAGNALGTSLVLGVSSGPDSEPIDWPLLFQEHAYETLLDSAYLSGPAEGAGAEGDSAATGSAGGDWLCQEDLGRVTCPEEKCHALRGRYDGLIVAEIDFASVARCCEACTAARVHGIPPHGRGCDVFSFCASEEGCGLMQPKGTCLLKVVSEDPRMGLAWSYDPLEPFTSGKVEA